MDIGQHRIDPGFDIVQTLPLVVQLQLFGLERDKLLLSVPLPAAIQPVIRQITLVRPEGQADGGGQTDPLDLFANIQELAVDALQPFGDLGLLRLPLAPQLQMFLPQLGQL